MGEETRGGHHRLICIPPPTGAEPRVSARPSDPRFDGEKRLVANAAHAQKLFQQMAQAPGKFSLGFGDVVHLPAALFAHQRIDERDLFAIAEGDGDLRRVACDGGRADLQVAGGAILAGNDRIKTQRALFALRRAVAVGLEGGDQPFREEGHVERRRIIGRLFDVIGIERLQKRLRGLERVGHRADGGQGEEDEAEEEGGCAHGGTSVRVADQRLVRRRGGEGEGVFGAVEGCGAGWGDSFLGGLLQVPVVIGADLPLICLPASSPRFDGEKRHVAGVVASSGCRHRPTLAPHLPAGTARGRAACLCPSSGPPGGEGTRGGRRRLSQPALRSARGSPRPWGRGSPSAAEAG